MATADDGSTACSDCGNIYDGDVAEGCPVCGYGTLGDGEVPTPTCHEHKEVLVDILQEHGPMKMRTLYLVYADRVDEPRVKRMVRMYLNELADENRVILRGEKKGRSYDAPDDGDEDAHGRLMLRD